MVKVLQVLSYITVVLYSSDHEGLGFIVYHKQSQQVMSNIKKFLYC